MTGSPLENPKVRIQGISSQENGGAKPFFFFWFSQFIWDMQQNVHGNGPISERFESCGTSTCSFSKEEALHLEASAEDQGGSDSEPLCHVFHRPASTPGVQKPALVCGDTTMGDGWPL